MSFFTNFLSFVASDFEMTHGNSVNSDSCYLYFDMDFFLKNYKQYCLQISLNLNKMQNIKTVIEQHTKNKDITNIIMEFSDTIFDELHSLLQKKWLRHKDLHEKFETKGLFGSHICILSWNKFFKPNTCKIVTQRKNIKHISPLLSLKLNTKVWLIKNNDPKNILKDDQLIIFQAEDNLFVVFEWSCLLKKIKQEELIWFKQPFIYNF